MLIFIQFFELTFYLHFIVEWVFETKIKHGPHANSKFIEISYNLL